jgi:hypothetical protein
MINPPFTSCTRVPNTLNAPTPSPPVLLPSVNRGDGKFEFITDHHTRKMLTNAFYAITTTETWDFVAKDRESFMFDNSAELYTIMDAMERGKDPPGHSGASFGWTMRHMQYLANHGIDKYRDHITKP